MLRLILAVCGRQAQTEKQQTCIGTTTHENRQITKNKCETTRFNMWMQTASEHAGSPSRYLTTETNYLYMLSRCFPCATYLFMSQVTAERVATQKAQAESVPFIHGLLFSDYKKAHEPLQYKICIEPKNLIKHVL